MKLYGRDKGIFAIESWPDYEDIYKKSIEVATFLDLPRFPDIIEGCYFHPNILCMKYLMEVNLPDEMHNFTCQVVKISGIGEVDFLTFDPIAKMAKTVKYDVQAIAVIVVVLKLLFLLDDSLEWSLSNLAEKYNEKNKEDKPWFNFRKWYQVMKKTVDEKKQKWEQARAKYLWKSEKPLYHSSIDKSVVYKRREMVVNLQKQFSTLVDSTPVVEKKGPSSFQFNWTEEDTDRTCFHGHSLQGILKKKGQSLTTRNSLYWLSTQKFCKSYCKHVTTYEESNFSLSYQFILSLFSFLLRIKTSSLHEEVSLIEKRLFETKYNKMKNKTSRSKKVRRR
ncbi:TATA box-binding protein-associated factor RNA polymerase I subunit B isoform X5 [Choloepus didactylus]|nr:TATA box-binding protein-associated factor RNA polymerase I subunit B isoform X5 [Choloepus didactylus]